MLASLESVGAELGYEPQVDLPERSDRVITLCCEQLDDAAVPAA